MNLSKNDKKLLTKDNSLTIIQSKIFIEMLQHILISLQMRVANLLLNWRKYEKHFKNRKNSFKNL